MKMTRLLWGLLFLTACGNPDTNPATEYISTGGETMGTFYSVTYEKTAERDFQPQFDSLLVAINAEVSTYIPTSTISVFNEAEAGLDIGYDYRARQFSSDSKEANGRPAGAHFARNYVLSQRIFELTDGAFDPTVMPLVNYWGFGYTGKEPVTNIDSLKVDSLLQLIGFAKVRYDSTFIGKEASGVKLDFSAVAKGYAVDVLGRFLEQRGVENYLVNIGGEVRARGRNASGDLWRLGINTPDSEAGVQDYELVVSLEDRSMATSGNYRNFYEVNGVKYAHTINPSTGFPELNNLLSASVLAPDCALADGLATAFMVMGYEEARKRAGNMEQVEACFIYGKEDGSLGVYYTDGLTDYIKPAE